MIRIEAVLLDLLAALVLGAFTGLALAPQEETGKDEQSNGHDRNDNGNGRLPACGEARAVLLRILQLSRAGGGRGMACSRGGARGRIGSRCGGNG